MTENEISSVILDAAIAVHKELGGPGLLESYYEQALAFELRSRGLKVEEQKLLPVIYKGVEIGVPYRLDLLVEDKVVVECKATEKDNPIFEAQTLTYLKISGCKLGIVINFGKKLIKDGWKRVAHNLSETSENLSAFSASSANSALK